MSKESTRLSSMMNQSRSTNSYVLLFSENLLNKTSDQTRQELVLGVKFSLLSFKERK